MCALYRRLLYSNLKLRRFFASLPKIDRFFVSEEVRTALGDDKPVVALESTIITHGMPYPENVKCALEVEAAIREQGAIPATIGILKGCITVGLSHTELTQLGDVTSSHPIKTSRRDLPFVVSRNLSGGTTVSATLLVAKKAKIPIFATGGIGGVHRGGEHTFDISADLVELGKSDVAVVSSGVKSILDIAKTLEFLETQGVFVATLASDSRDFPAFYCRKSGCQAPYLVETAQEAARIIHCCHNLDVRSGMLFAVPVPEKFALDESVINDVIEEALKDAGRRGVEGKEITPFLLGRIAEITAGKSLETNVALIKNNAKTAAAVAVELANLRREEKGSRPEGNDGPKQDSRPVVIGGSNLDCSIKLRTAEIKMDGRIHFGRSIVSGGGVGRNICEALSKLGCPPEFVSVLGDDPHGVVLRNFIPKSNMTRVKILPGRSTGYCTVVFDSQGECKFLAGDMDIHREITPEVIRENEEIIKKAPLIVFDANLTIPTIETVLELAKCHNIPAFFEPTDVEVCIKPFQTKSWRAIKFISPNLNELKYIASFFKIPRQSQYENKIDEAADMAKKLSEYVDNIIVTLGPDGVVIARKGEARESLLHKRHKLAVRHYPTEKIKEVVNVSGAGDSLTSGIIAAMLVGCSEEECVSVGFAAAQTALFSWAPVAQELFGKNHESWTKKATYKTYF